MNAVKDQASVDKYVRQVMDMRAMLANLREFVNTLPAPDDDNYLPGMDYAQIGTLNEMHSQLTTLASVPTRSASSANESVAGDDSHPCC